MVHYGIANDKDRNASSRIANDKDRGARLVHANTPDGEGDASQVATVQSRTRESMARRASRRCSDSRGRQPGSRSAVARNLGVRNQNAEQRDCQLHDGGEGRDGESTTNHSAEASANRRQRRATAEAVGLRMLRIHDAEGSTILPTRTRQWQQD